eukprot:3110737-Prymnesium_polylepis.1
MEPEVLYVPLQRAAESQVAFIRAVGCISEAELPGAQFAFARDGSHGDNCAIESLHLGPAYGGCGWANPTYTAPLVFAAGLVDRLQLIRAMPHTSGAIPPVSEWLRHDALPPLATARRAIDKLLSLP